MPVDDGAADHLLGTMLPQLTLESSQGPVSMRELAPRAARALRLPARRPARARRCRRLGRHSRARAAARRSRARSATTRRSWRSSVRRVAGLSAQTLDDQLEFAERNHMPYPVIADPELSARSSAAAADVRRRGRRRSTSGSRSSSKRARSRRSSTRSSRRTRTPKRSSPGWRSAREARDVRRRARSGASTATSSSSSTSPSMREYFERGGADDAGREHALADVKLRAPIVPKKFFHTAGNFREHEDESKRVDWSHEIAPWIVFFQNVDAIVGPDDADRLSGAPDRGARLRARARGRDQASRASGSRRRRRPTTSAAT